MALARYVLRDQPKWTPEAIEAAMHAGSETHVKLLKAIPIHIVYFTAWVDANGGLHFRHDVYGYDARQASVAVQPQSRRPAGTKARRTGEAPTGAGVQTVVATGDGRGPVPPFALRASARSHRSASRGGGNP
jgi:hypothetical protein